MWLKRTSAERLLTSNRITRAELAKELGIGESHLSRILDGKTEADEELTRLFISAFGADEIEKAIDWERTAA
jgi:transcriptional regulator with XRE-family HTH domain